MKWIRRLFVAILVTFGPMAIANDTIDLNQLLDDFLANTVEDDFKNHNRFWSNELVYTSSAGTRFDKNKIIRDIQGASEEPKVSSPEPTYSAEDTDIRVYGRTAIVAFKLVATWMEEDAQKQQRYFNTGTFLKRKGQWRAVAWQATKIPEESDVLGQDTTTK